MNIGVTGREIFGEINAIPSKSYAHRIAICNFLAGNKPTANCNGFSSNDIKVTEDCLEKLNKGEKILDCGESGSTLRFLIPLVATLGGEYEFIGHGKLMERPNQELFAVLNSHGVQTQNGKTIRISGKMGVGEYKIRGDISSQYISGLLMALSGLNGQSQIILTTPLASSPYVDITIQVLNGYGVKIDKTQNGFIVYGKGKLCGSLKPEGDWSNSAFFLVLGAICGSVKVKGLNPNSVQGDRYITEILTKSGANVTIEKDGVTASKKELKGFTFDCENCPDLVPIASVLGAYANGTTIIKNVQRLKIKESDRVQSTIEMLAGFNVLAKEKDNDLIIYGGNVRSGKANSFNDHRIAMSTAILGAGVVGESIVFDAKAVNKSYPTFFEDYNKVGGNSYEL